MKMCDEIYYNFQRNCFAYAKLSLLTQLFPFNPVKYQRSLQYGDPAAAQLVRPLMQSWLYLVSLQEQNFCPVTNPSSIL
jgi:hypothetical protein